MSEIELLQSNHKQSYFILFKRVVYKIIWAVFALWTPRFFNPLRIIILKLFGAKIGKKVLIKGSVRIDMPWNLEIGNYSAIGDRVWLYNTGLIKIGCNTVISQDATICTASHDYSHPFMPLYSKPICIEKNVWVSAESFVMPGVCIREGVVVGARSVVTRDLSSWTVCAGQPCNTIKKRTLKGLDDSFELSKYYC